jgi:hypothetical protein
VNTYEPSPALPVGPRAGRDTGDRRAPRSLALVDRLLRAPSDVARECRDDLDLAPVAAHALAIIAVGALLFGSAVGSWRGGVQIAFAAVKLPIVTLGTLAVCVPAFHAVAAVFGRPWSLRSAIALMLASGARFSLVLLAATPAVWLFINLGASYDATKLLAAFAYALGGLAALGLLLRGLGPGPGRIATVLTFVTVFLIVGGQSAWILRPYLGTPERGDITFFTNEREGGLAYQLWVSLGYVLGPRRPGPSS